MKNKSYILVMMLFMITIKLYAYDFEVNGIYYTIISRTDLTCGVTYKSSSGNNYSGNIIIPERVSYNDNEYIVNTICDHAFEKCSKLKSVSMPETINKIGFGAFRYCI